MSPTPAQVLAAVKKSGVTYQLMPGWDSAAIAAPGAWDPHYVILHHTANGGAPGNNPSLGWVIHDNYAPIRACHFLIGRDGKVFVIYALGCYHAGAGGPGKWGNGPLVAKDTMNHYAYGIEIESKGTSLTVDNVNGYTVAQKSATAALTRELLALMGATVECAINHRTWAPGRKNDTLMSDAEWHALIRAALVVPPTPPAPLPLTDLEVAMLISRTDSNSIYLLIGGHLIPLTKVTYDSIKGELPTLEADPVVWASLVSVFPVAD